MTAIVVTVTFKKHYYYLYSEKLRSFIRQIVETTGLSSCDMIEHKKIFHKMGTIRKKS